MRLFFVLLALTLVSIALEAREGAFESSGYLGMNVSYQDEPALGEGRMTVEIVYPGSPAARAGLSKGDVLTRVNGITFRFADWTATMESGGPFTWVAAGDRVRLSLLRSGKPIEIEVVAVTPPAEVVAARQSLQSKLLMQKGNLVLDRLSRQGTTVEVQLSRVEGQPAGDRLRVSAPGLTDLDAEALALYLSSSRLRILFAKLEPGGSLRLELATHPGTDDPSIEVLKP